MRKTLQKIPRLLRFLFFVTVLNVTIFFALRLVFWLVFQNPGDPAPAGHTITAFYLGSKYDLQLALLMIAPVFLLGWISRLSPFQSKVMQHVWLIYLITIMFALLFVYAFDFGHYAYLNRRIDATVLRFLENFNISMQMVWQTYSVITWIMGFIASLLIYSWVIYRLQAREQVREIHHLRWHGKLMVAPASALLVLFGVYGKFSYYPLRWSDAFFSPHNFSAAVAANPVVYFANTFKNRSIMFDENTTRKYYALMHEFLRIDQADDKTLNYQRHVRNKPAINSQPNIVLVFLESFAAYKTTTFGNPLNPTPRFDEFAKDGILFTRYYSPLTGTARSVFAAVTGLPDIELNKTSTRNPLVVNQHTLINAFAGYDKYYFIGGSASWGNIRGLLAHNIPGLKLYEEGSYASPRMDVWGIDDLHLFDEANQVLRQQQKPFFAIIQTAGNHRPYGIPEDHRGFKLDQQEQKTLEKSGFIENDEYNAFRFMDHSIGFFIDSARREKYFDNTIFVFYGDHGISGYGGDHTPAFNTHHDLNGLHVPLLIYAPKLLKPQRLNKIASELDLLPTVAGLTLSEFTNTTLGRDLLDPQFDQQRVAFTMMDDTIGLVNDRFYYRFNQSNGDKALYDTQYADPRANVAKLHPQVMTQMETLTQGLYETTKYMMYHNSDTALHAGGNKK